MIGNGLAYIAVVVRDVPLVAGILGARFRFASRCLRNR